MKKIVIIMLYLAAMQLTASEPIPTVPTEDLQCLEHLADSLQKECQQMRCFSESQTPNERCQIIRNDISYQRNRITEDTQRDQKTAKCNNTTQCALKSDYRATHAARYREDSSGFILIPTPYIEGNDENEGKITPTIQHFDVVFPFANKGRKDMRFGGHLHLQTAQECLDKLNTFRESGTISESAMGTCKLSKDDALKLNPAMAFMANTDVLTCLENDTCKRLITDPEIIPSEYKNLPLTKMQRSPLHKVAKYYNIPDYLVPDIAKDLTLEQAEATTLALLVLLGGLGVYTWQQGYTPAAAMRALRVSGLGQIDAIKEKNTASQLQQISIALSSKEKNMVKDLAQDLEHRALANTMLIGTSGNDAQKMAKAIAKEAKADFIQLNIARLNEMAHDQASLQATIDELFAYASRRNIPVALYAEHINTLHTDAAAYLQSKLSAISRVNREITLIASAPSLSSVPENLALALPTQINFGDMYRLANEETAIKFAPDSWKKNQAFIAQIGQAFGQKEISPVRMRSFIQTLQRHTPKGHMPTADLIAIKAQKFIDQR